MGIALSPLSICRRCSRLGGPCRPAARGARIPTGRLLLQPLVTLLSLGNGQYRREPRFPDLAGERQASRVSATRCHDDRIVAELVESVRARPPAPIVLVTRDINLQSKVDYAGLAYREPPDP